MRDAICPHEKCTLCMACVNICPKNAIYMDYDEYGYEMIRINPHLCVDCGLCDQVCQKRQSVTRNIPRLNYAAQMANKTALRASASGGAFQTLAKIVLEQDGVCYGCAFDKENDGFHARHVRIDRLSDLPRILNTKYIPSLVGYTYREAMVDLKAGRLVLFSGTPCQIQGLRSYLTRDYENLLTVDLICHGVSGSRYFNDYVGCVENRENIRITDFSFRDKSVSWGTNFCYSYYKQDDELKKIRQQHLPREASSYTMHYLRGDIFRENCHTCTLSCVERVSDFTLGDYWEIEQEHPEFVISKRPSMSLRGGVSCILANTDRAQKLMPLLEKKMIVHPVSLKSVSDHNGNLQKPTPPGVDRERIITTYRTSGYQPIDDAYRKSVGKKMIVYRLKNILKSRLPDRVRILIYRSTALRRLVFHK